MTSKAFLNYLFMKMYICIALLMAASCNKAGIPVRSISNSEKQRIYSLTKDTLNVEWIRETKTANWKVVSINKNGDKTYVIKTRKRGQAYKGFFINVYLDSSMQISTVGKEISDAFD